MPSIVDLQFKNKWSKKHPFFESVLDHTTMFTEGVSVPLPKNRYKEVYKIRVLTSRLKKRKPRAYIITTSPPYITVIVSILWIEENIPIEAQNLLIAKRLKG